MDPPAPSVVRCAYVVPNKGRRCRFPVPFYKQGVNLGSTSIPSKEALPVSAAAEDVVQDWIRRISDAWPRAVADDMHLKGVVPEAVLVEYGSGKGGLAAAVLRR
eukprot:g8496.t1